MTDAPLFLVADIGGTNTRVGLTDGTVVRPDSVRRYANRENEGIAPVLRRYRDETATGPVDGACVAVAGPVRGGHGALTNLDWSIDDGSLAQAADAPFGAILNDLQAQGHALGHLAPNSLRTIMEGPADAAPDDATCLVVNVGTGFNIAAVHTTPSGRLVPPAEAGHASLPVRTDEELDLLRFVSAAHGFPAVEDVLSGRGLERIYSWLSDKAGIQDRPKAVEILARLRDGDARAVAAVRQFVRTLGTVAGNLALDHLPFGGVFLVGGVVHAVADQLSPMGFRDAFRDKGRFSDFMDAFPVHLVTDDYAALAGCAAHLTDGVRSRRIAPAG